MFRLACAALACCIFSSAVGAENARWKNGPPETPDYFPIAVWLQDAKNAKKYQDLGINLYIALWEGPTETQLQALTAAGMPVVCSQNEVGLKHKDDKIIVGWMHGDEPDNAQSLGTGKGYGPPIVPQKIIDDYKKIQAADPTRPVLLNLGQGVAWDGWHGRGVRTNKPEDYAEYVKGGDIVSFDIYPVAHDHKDVSGNLWFVPKGVERLRQWSNDQKSVWNCIECTHIGSAKMATPHDVRAEVWMSLIAGSKGLIYFSHEFKPKFIEAGLLAYPEMAAAVKAINTQIKELAPALNSPTLKDAAAAKSSVESVPVAFICKRLPGALYLFSATTRKGASKVTFTIPELKDAQAEVFGENRKIDIIGGAFADDFGDYDVRLYKIALQK
ncbi:MAG TPA: hypothetical protein VGP72_33985 [Planctomycetota bacterium]|jgi:hypothetical protein